MPAAANPMTEFLARLKQRKLVQWSIAYVAFAFALLQGVDVVAQQFGWPESIRRGVTLALALGFCVTLVLAWYHGERGVQRVGGVELLILALLLAVGGGLLWRFVHAPQPAPVAAAEAAGAPANDPASTASIPDKSIAVLPFENLSDDKDNEYFVAGMQDLILTKLADVGDLKVISRTSTEKYKSRPDNLKKVAAELGVATVLEGSVQKHGNEVLINVQLIDARSDAHIWANAYPRTLDNIFGVEGEVAEKIAAALQAKLSPDESSRLADKPTQNEGAMDAFLRAEFLFHRGHVDYNTATMRQALPLYRQAIAKDPHFALALARLSYAESLIAWFSSEPDAPKLIADARADAERSLALQPGLADGHLALGYCEYYGAHDYDKALQQFDAALRARPNDAWTMAARGYVLRRQGDFEASIDALRKAVDLDPRNVLFAYNLGADYAAVRRYADAERVYRRALALDPGNDNVRLFLVNSIMYGSGDLDRAMAVVQGDSAAQKMSRLFLLYLQRKYRERIALMESLPDTPDVFDYISGPKVLALAQAHWVAGDKAQAHALFTRALPVLRNQLATVGDNPTKAALVWVNIADTELNLGHAKAAFTALDKSRALVAQAGDHIYGPTTLTQLASIYAEAKRADLAVPLLRQVLDAPGGGLYYSPLMLRIDPSWDPIRNDPHFVALLKQYPADSSASASGNVADE